MLGCFVGVGIVVLQRVVGTTGRRGGVGVVVTPCVGVVLTSITIICVCVYA